MKTIKISTPKRSHLLSVVKSLLSAGWIVDTAPQNGRLASNGQLVILREGKRDVRLRLFAYKVTGSSRGNPGERRIEITSTYQKGLRRKREYQDVVLGMDHDHEILVGVDARRLGHGGPTGNASSFFDREGLNWTKRNEILVVPRAAKLFLNGTEFHAFFNPSCLVEYLLNVDTIHDGTYAGAGLYSGGSDRRKTVKTLDIPLQIANGNILIMVGPKQPRVRSKVHKRLIRAFEEGDTSRVRQKMISPEQLQFIKRRCEENGRIGEEFVLNYERRRIRRAGKATLAEKVKWVSQKSTCEGYDILSFELDGKKRLIEVKSTVGNGFIFEMSENEWRRAKKEGRRYYIYRVTDVRARPTLKIFADPAELEARGLMSKSPSGWRITLL